MSFDIFLCCVGNGKGAAFKRELFEEIFLRGAIDPRLPLTNVDYVDGGADIYGGDDGDEIEHMMFNHCGGDSFFAALHELADRSGSFITWPSYGPQIATPYQDVAAHLPPDLKDGPVAIVKSGRELEALIGRTTKNWHKPG